MCQHNNCETIANSSQVVNSANTRIDKDNKNNARNSSVFARATKAAYDIVYSRAGKIQVDIKSIDNANVDSEPLLPST